MTKYFSKWKPGMKKGKNGKYYYPKKGKKMVRYNSRKPRRYNTSNMIISKPLLPEVQKVCLKYYTRFHIDPVAVASGAADTASDIPIHTFAWNDAYDIDKTHTLAQQGAGVMTGRQQDGAPDHQPRMYDQYGVFYDKLTVIGAQAKVTFSNASGTAVTFTDQVGGGRGAVIETIDSKRATSPMPSFVGYLNSTYNDEAVVHEKWDNLREKNEVRFRRLIDDDKPQTMLAKWSLEREEVYRSGLKLDSDAEAPENFTALWNHSPTNLRFLHLFAHPITVTNHSNPAPVDVEVEISQICLLSARKEINQS